MFVSINIYFRSYEFLYSSLSFFEDKALIQCINKCHFGVVKIVSVLLPMFTWKTFRKNVCIKRNIRFVHNNRSSLQRAVKIRFFYLISDVLIFLKPHMLLNLLTSICFQKNLRTSPKKLTYDNFAKNQPYVAAVTNVSRRRN